MTEQEIIRLCSEYKRNKRQAEELQKQNERIRQLLLDELKERGEGSATAGEYKFAATEVKSERIDGKRLKEALPTVWSGYVVVTSATRLTVK